MEKCRMRIEEVLVTPEKAVEWLGCNIKRNRPILTDRETSYAHDMVSGKWIRNGETIKFDTNGKLIDGQHRLRAIVDTGLSIKMDVAYNVPEDAFKTIDTGAPRNYRQIMRMDGNEWVNKKNLVPIAMLFVKLIAGERRPTYAMVEEFIRNNYDRFEWFYSVMPNCGNVPAVYGAVAISAHILGVDDKEIVGFVRGSTRQDFDPTKNPNVYKYCIQCENHRKGAGKHYVRAMYEATTRYLFSYVNEYGRLTSRNDLYEVQMGSNYRLIPAKD